MDNKKSMTKIIAIIPARGGSQRIKGKNIIDFHGKPMILHTLEAAKECGIFTKIVVSTDCHETKEICEASGFGVPFLRKEYSDNMSSVNEATISALIQAESYFNENYDVVIQLMPNSPLRTSEDILNQYARFQQQKASFSISCTMCGWQNPWWSFQLQESNRAEWNFPDALKSRSQDLPDLFVPNGAVWIASVASLKLSKSFYQKETLFFEMDFINSMDIDTVDDLELAKKLY